MVRLLVPLMILLALYFIECHGFVMPCSQWKHSMSSVRVKGTQLFPHHCGRHVHRSMQTSTSSVSTISQLNVIITSVSTHILNIAISFLQMLINILNKFKPKSMPLFQQIIKGEKVIVRKAYVDDTSLVMDFILELADFEQLKDQVTATSSSLKPKLFPSDASLPHPRVLILEINDQPAGFVLYFYNFSTFVGKNGIYIEDLYVREKFRKRGYGTLLLQQLCQVAKKEDCGRIEWWCLDWNKNAIEFYTQKLQAEAMDEWTVYRLNREMIDSIANM